ncbi:VWA domain-containing protein [Kitasatospora sp. NPDC088783]|uniref:VWA domain-containing protein n=1 Tax=Kitasatospora sp. NPDC088783 TaxID=3364077 RepID=UPI003814770A
MLRKLFASRRPAPACAPAVPDALRPGGNVAALTEAARAALAANHLTGQRAAVYLVLDRSKSMLDHYDNGTMRRLGEHTLALAAALGDGRVPVVFFSTGLDATTVLDPDNHAGLIDTAHGQLGPMGRTNYTPAIDAVIDHHREHGAAGPALVLFQTDGHPTDEAAAKTTLTAAKDLPIFWVFTVFGDTTDFPGPLTSRAGVKNTAFVSVPDPRHLDHQALYTRISTLFATYLTSAHETGLLP